MTAPFDGSKHISEIVFIGNTKSRFPYKQYTLHRMSKKRPLPAWMQICKVRKEENDCSHGDQNSRSETSSSKLKKAKEDRKIDESLAFDKLLEQSLPEWKFSGNLVYSYHKGDCGIIAEDIELSFCDIENGFIGFDMEWPVTYQAGQQDKTALLQLCTADDTCYLFHLSCMGSIPTPLCQLLQNQNIKKVGVGIESDLWKLERDYDISVINIIKHSMVDLSHYANKVLKSSENWSLEGLTRHLFKHRINKGPSVRKSNWSHYPLTEEQKNYAATDAFVSYKIFDKLRTLGS